MQNHNMRGIINTALLVLAAIATAGVVFVSQQPAKETADDPTFGAPNSLLTYHKTLLPITDSLYDLGTTTLAWRDLFVDQICLSGDCKSAWPIGGGGGSSAYEIATETPLTIGQVSYFTKTSGRTTLGGVATGTVSAGTGISLDDSTRSVVGGALQITNSSPLSGLVANWPFAFSNPTLTWAGLSTTTNSGMAQGNLYVGTGGVFQTAASSSIFGYTPLNPTRQLTIAGTAQQITSSAGAQDLSADRTWTLSLPAHVVFPNSFQAAEATTTNATSTNLSITSLGQGWLFSEGNGPIRASTTPTVNAIFATSTSATSTFAWAIRATCFTSNGTTCISGSGGSSNWTDGGAYLSPITAGDGVLVNSASSTITNLSSLISSTTALFVGTLDSTSDAATQYGKGTNNAFIEGLDYDQNTFVIASGTALGTNNLLSITKGGKLTFNFASTTAITNTGVASTTFLRIDRLADGCLDITSGLVGSQACGGGGFTWPFPNNATTTHIAFNTLGYSADIGSTTQATSTGLTVTGNLVLPSTIASSLLWADGGSSLRATTTPTATTFYSTGVVANRFPYASSTAFSATELCLTGDSCISTWPTGGGFSWPWIPVTNYGTTTNSTTTMPWFKMGLQASSTSHFDTADFANGITVNSGNVDIKDGSLATDVIDSWAASFIRVVPRTDFTGGILVNSGTSTITNLRMVNASSTDATTTNQTITGNWIVPQTSALLLVDAGGTVGEYGGDSCTNQFVRSINGAGVVTCATVDLAADVTGTLPISRGGTGTTTSAYGHLYYGSASAMQTVATTSASCLGGTSCSSFTVIGASPVTISSTEPFTWPFPNNATTTHIAFNTLGYSADIGSTTQATSTGLTVTGNVVLPSTLASSLLWADGGSSLRATTTPTALSFYATSNTASRFPYASSTAWSSAYASSTSFAFYKGTMTFASTTALSASELCLTGDTCISTWPTGGGGSDPFTHPAVGQSATTSLMLFDGKATSTQFSAYKAYFGGTATSTFDAGGVPSFPLTGLLQGNGAGTNVSAITDSSTVGQVLRVTGASTYAWGQLNLASSDAVTGTLPVGNGGTGAASFGQGWIYSTGSGALAASTSPTVNYLVSTSTTANNLFAGKVGVSTTSPFKLFSVGGESWISATTTTYGLNVQQTGTATSSVYIYSKTAGKGGAIILEDVDGAGCTEITALNGVLSAQIVTCNTEI